MDITQETMKELRRAEEVVELNALMQQAQVDALVLPEGFNVHHLEKYRASRERLTGRLGTGDIGSFQSYIKAFSSAEKTLVFVEPKTMTATGMLNFGTVSAPGHADHAAALKLEMTAEYKAMLRVAESGGRSAQKATAEWCEDHVDFITFMDAEGAIIEPARAIKAIRNLKVEDQQKLSSGVGNFNRERTLMESSKVDTTEGLPHFLLFKCVPYQGLSDRAFKVRLGTGQSSQEPSFTFHIVRHDIEIQAMAEELAALIRERMGDEVDVYLGAFSK